MIDLTGVAVAVLSLLAAWITSQVVPWIKARTTAEQRRVAQALVKTAVYAAEMLFSGSDKGEVKLQYVKDRLAAAGVELDTKHLADLIEEAVLELTIKRDWALEHSNAKEDLEEVVPLG